MFVKQIDLNEALRLASKGREIKVMAPNTSEPEKWTDYEPDTLQHLLDGCLFFRTEPAMEKSDLGVALHEVGSKFPPNADGAAAEPAVGTKKLSGKRVSTATKRKPVDTGRMMALHNAGWSNVKIADDMGISDVTVGKYLKQMLGEKN